MSSDSKPTKSQQMYSIGDHVLYHPSSSKQLCKGVIQDIAVDSAFQTDEQAHRPRPEHWTQEHHRVLIQQENGSQEVVKFDAIEKKI
ncbi:hypothetical protein IWQ60_012001 [Tieghemiomyces parasiticus]|uniref:Uncharacterized protein n=1 Tax=Tieghemiomyces parasiticus TaxID=78921 RepID=A0A9W7ZHI7_9FUNG|nr:hypothetical protein IWQ60_012057 [Tieghemiomyces parasiticus]KAJ1906796.1 hypothetical protein IWQ60_012001 [Tieghemiomyces parasiticus]